VCERDRGAEVDLEHPVHLLLREFGQQPAGWQRGVRDEHIEPGRLHLASEASDLLAIGEVARNRPPPHFLGKRLERLQAPSGQDQTRSPGGERPRDRVADAAGRTGDEHVSVCEGHGAAV